MQKKILIIDDDEKLNRLLKEYFGRFNYNVFTFTNPVNALQKLEKVIPDLIVLDIMMPELDGFEVCKRIRQRYEIPIIMLTARGEVTDKIVGLELGADDYMSKPFEPRELVARIQTILRRTKNKSYYNRIKFENIEIDYTRYSVKVNNEHIDITSAEFELLALLAKNPDIVLTRDKIFEKIKGLDVDTFDRSIDVMISRIRQKLGDDPGNPHFIKTVRGIGYKFIGYKTDD